MHCTVHPIFAIDATQFWVSPALACSALFCKKPRFDAYARHFAAHVRCIDLFESARVQHPPSMQAHAGPIIPHLALLWSLLKVSETQTSNMGVISLTGSQDMLKAHALGRLPITWTANVRVLQRRAPNQEPQLGSGPVPHGRQE